jgi:uncharacterized protein (DUF1786 family)
MKILSVDIGTGTQDILLYDSNLDIENCFKLILPSPTMRIYRRLKQELQASRRRPLLLTGHQMGGGPSAWAIEECARAGIPVYMTPSAATTINDELDQVQALGIEIVSNDEAERLRPKIEELELRDFDFGLIRKTFNDYGVSLNDLEAVAVAVFDHGNAPAGVSDRQFRFDYLDEQIKSRNSLSAFAYPSHKIPKIMSRLQSVADSAVGLACPLVVMDTAPAAILGADLDARVAARNPKIVCNVGNFHTLAFRLGAGGIEGVFEHHTGEIDREKLERLIRALADGSLRHEDVFDDMGHGALMYSHERLEFGKDEFDVAVTGPRRSIMAIPPAPQVQVPSEGERNELRPYFATPFGDMMIAGCFGLLAATAEILPDVRQAVSESLRGRQVRRAPWEA